MSTEPTSTSITKPVRRGWALAAIVGLFVLHTFQASRLFPSLGAILDPESPVVMVDHAIHEYHGRLGATFLREHGTTWGYDPFFMAGYPETPVWDSSSNPSIALDFLGGRDGYRAYKVGLFVASIAVLAGIAGGAWAAGLGAAEVAVATFLGWFVFWSGFPVSLWRSGLFAFVTAASGAGVLLGLCVRFDRKPTRWNWCLLAAAGSGLCFVHVTTPIMVAAGAVAFYATVARRHGRRWHAAVLGAAVVTILANLFWLVPLWRFRGLRIGSGLFMTTDSAWFLVRHYLAPTVEGRTGLVLFVTGLAGLAGWWFGGRRAMAAAFGGSIVALVMLTGFGSLWNPTKVLEPLRFRVAFGFLLAVPAASAVVGLTSWIARRVGGRWRGGLVAGLLWIGVLGGWVAVERGFFQASARSLFLQRPLTVGLTTEMKTLVGWIKANTDLTSRILFEDQLRLLESTDPESTHWTPLLPLLLRPDIRLFIGGLYQTAFIKHHAMAAFGDFQLGDRPIDEWSKNEFDDYCLRYNLGWVICWSPLSRFWFDRYESAVRVATLPRYVTPYRPVSTNEHEWTAMIRRAGIDQARRYMTQGEGAYAIYRIERPRSYFLKGKGRLVSVAPNRIELADVEPEEGEVIVSLHWLDTWRSEPPLPLFPEPASPDPIDFVRIKLTGPLPSIVLTNGYGRR
jgi:hypothetical protein